MSIQALSIALVAVFFWAFNKVFNPQPKKYAVQDFLKVDQVSSDEQQVISKSSVHQVLYPLYLWLQKRNPFAKQRYEALLEELEKAGEFNTRPEDIQIAQIFNGLLYPVAFIVLSLFVDGRYSPYLATFGMAVGVWMYNAPIRNLKAKRIQHNENKLQNFTRFVTIYIMQSSGNKTPYDAIQESLQRVRGKVPALQYYFNTLENELNTKGPDKALRDFSRRMDEAYVERFVNNILLSMDQAGGDQKDINIRLRETLIELQEQLTDEKISRMKVTARVPTYIMVLLIAIYMIVMLGVSMIMLF